MCQVMFPHMYNFHKIHYEITDSLLLVKVPRPRYGGRHTVTLLPGDGVGPELMRHVREVFR